MSLLKFLNVFRSGITALGSTKNAVVNTSKSLQLQVQRDYTSCIKLGNGENSSLLASGTGTILALSSRNGTNLLNDFSGVMYSSVRTIIRVNFPRARENKRLGVHGYAARMKTPSQRRVIMRRILKGRHSLWHA